MELVAVSAPTAGSCSVVPTNASLTQFIALETKFVVSTSSWAAVDLPLSYTFKASRYGVVSTLAPFALRATVEDVYLPVGAPVPASAAVALAPRRGTATTARRRRRWHRRDAGRSSALRQHRKHDENQRKNRKRNFERKERQA